MFSGQTGSQMKLNQFNVGLRVSALAGMLLLGTAVTGGLAWR